MSRDPWPRRCVVGVPDYCTGIAQHRHHVVLRARGGTNDPSNLIDVCFQCHNFIHANPKWATANGFMARRSA